MLQANLGVSPSMTRTKIEYRPQKAQRFYSCDPSGFSVGVVRLSARGRQQFPPPLRGRIKVGGSSGCTSVPPSQPSPTRGEGAPYGEFCALLDTHGIVGRTILFLLYSAYSVSCAAMISEISEWFSRVHAKTMDKKRGAEAPLWYGFIKSLEAVRQAQHKRAGGVARCNRCGSTGGETRQVKGAVGVVIHLDISSVSRSTL